MNKPRLAALILAAVLLAGTAPAVAPNVEIQSASYSGSVVSVKVYNPERGVQEFRIQLKVVLAGGTVQTLTSPNVIVAARSTVIINLTAGGTVAGIGDDPEPIPSLP